MESRKFIRLSMGVTRRTQGRCNVVKEKGNDRKLLQEAAICQDMQFVDCNRSGIFAKSFVFNQERIKNRKTEEIFIESIHHRMLKLGTYWLDIST